MMATVTATATEAADLCLCGCCCCLWFLPRCHIWCESQKGAHNVRSGLTMIVVVIVVSADAVGDKSEVDAGSGRSSSPSYSSPS